MYLCVATTSTAKQLPGKSYCGGRREPGTKASYTQPVSEQSHPDIPDGLVCAS